MADKLFYRFFLLLRVANCCVTNCCVVVMHLQIVSVGKFRCDICSKSCSSESSLNRHHKRKHDSNRRIKTKLHCVSFDDCDVWFEGTKDTRYRLTRQRRSGNEEPVRRATCSKWVADETAHHNRIHAELKCGICSQSVSGVLALKKLRNQQGKSDMT